MLLTPAQIKPKSFESRRSLSFFFFSSFFFFLLFLLLFNFFFYPEWMRLMFTKCVLGRLVASTVLSVQNLLKGADRVGGQLRGDKECPFSGVTKPRSLEEGAGKRCSECGISHRSFGTPIRHRDFRSGSRWLIGYKTLMYLKTCPPIRRLRQTLQDEGFHVKGCHISAML